jgi:hypothetical protein
MAVFFIVPVVFLTLMASANPDNDFVSGWLAASSVILIVCSVTAVATSAIRELCQSSIKNYGMLRELLAQAEFNQATDTACFEQS